MTNFIMMIGPSASGKSTFANGLSESLGLKVISSDGLRKELYGDEAIQGNNNFLFSQLHKMILETLEKDESVIFDATNLSRKNRMALLEKIPSGVYKEGVVIVTPFEKIYENNKNRLRKVPEEVIRRQLRQFEMPVYQEGFNGIVLHFPFECMYSVSEALKMMKGFEQDNPNHSLDLLNHCASTCGNLLLKEMDLDLNLLSAAMFHDIGKVFTKTFKNMKGEETDIAHYYSHNNIGSYFSLLIEFGSTMRNEDKIEIAQLICYHMQPYFCKSEKAMKRWEERLGSELWEKILKLHEADKQAH